MTFKRDKPHPDQYLDRLTDRPVPATGPLSAKRTPRYRSANDTPLTVDYAPCTEEFHYFSCRNKLQTCGLDDPNWLARKETLKAYERSKLPKGAMMEWHGEAPPEGWEMVERLTDPDHAMIIEKVVPGIFDDELAALAS